MDLHLLKFGKGYSWFRVWDNLQQLNNKIINQQLKLIIPEKNVAKQPSKFYACTLTKALSEESAYEQGTSKIEEFLFLSNIYLNRSFRPLLEEAITLPFPKTHSINNISLEILDDRVNKIISDEERWTLEVPYFGAITPSEKSIDFYPAHFEITDIQSKISEHINVISKQKWLAFENHYEKLCKIEDTKKDLLVIIGQLYASASSSETIALSYMMLWEILRLIQGLTKIEKHCYPRVF